MLAALSASIALAEDFKTIEGKEYKNASVSRVELIGIVLKRNRALPKSISLNYLKTFRNAFITIPRISAEQATAAQQDASFGDDRLGGTADQFAARYGAPQDSPASTRISRFWRERSTTPTNLKDGRSGWHLSNQMGEPFEWSIENYQNRRQPNNTGLRVASDHDGEHAGGDNVERNWLTILIILTKGRTKFSKSYFGSTWRKDVATQRRRDLLVT